GYPYPPPDGDVVTLRFQVEDTGIGIPVNQVEAIFRPFYQANNFSQHLHGSGLGLAISQTLIQLMGADLYVTSHVNKGSTFWFDLTLPLGTNHSYHASHGPDMPVTGHQHRVLVVEDDDINRTLLERLLNDQGFQVNAVTNGQEGLTMALSWNPHIILTDLIMPKMDGIEMTRHLRQIPSMQSVAIVAISANAFQETKEQCLAAGCTAFLSKPIKLPQLQDILTEHLSLAATPEPVRILPPQSDLNALAHLAIIGDIDAILGYITQLVETNSDYGLFAQDVEQLARGFQIERLNRFLSRYQQSPEPE
ncbi:MAG: response regulator, partial [Okeania sp. SIO3B3]|nr:response regulator [Okeania sp. SIO3B3]